MSAHLSSSKAMAAASATMLHDQLRQALSQWVTLSESQWQQVSQIFRVRQAAAQEHVVLPASTVHEVLFVCQGLLRFYYMNDKDAESNKAFIAENTFAGPLGASALGLPVIYGVQALEPTTLLVASFADFTALYDQDPVFDRLGRRLAEWLLMRKELRARSLLLQQAKERYLDFVANHANLVQRVPQYHIASYLGITEVSLSRLRRSLMAEARV